jgi:hypothetical protein
MLHKLKSKISDVKPPDEYDLPPTMNTQSMSETFDAKEPEWRALKAVSSNSSTSEEKRTVLASRSPPASVSNVTSPARSQPTAKPFDEFYKNHPEHKLAGASNFAEPMSPKRNDLDDSMNAKGASPHITSLWNRERRRREHSRTKSNPSTSSDESTTSVRRSGGSVSVSRSKVREAMLRQSSSESTESNEFPPLTQSVSDTASPMASPPPTQRKRTVSMNKETLGKILGDQNVAEAYHFVAGPKKSLPTPRS